MNKTYQYIQNPIRNKRPIQWYIEWIKVWFTKLHHRFIRTVIFNKKSFASKCFIWPHCFISTYKSPRYISNVNKTTCSIATKINHDLFVLQSSFYSLRYKMLIKLSINYYWSQRNGSKCNTCKEIYINICSMLLTKFKQESSNKSACITEWSLTVAWTPYCSL